jgi:hypothetical protein
MTRTMSLAAVFLLLGLTSASAENWVNAGQTQYDAESVYVGASDGLVYFTVCMQDKCVPDDTAQMIMYMRYDCDAGMESNMEAFEETWIAPSAHTGALESMLCAQRASLHRH